MKTGNKDGTVDATIEMEKTANEKIRTLYENREKKRDSEKVAVTRNKRRRKIDSDSTKVIEGWNPKKCPILIVEGADDVTTLKVKSRRMETP